MSKLDFAIGEMKCGRLPWFAPEVWLVIGSFIMGVGFGVIAGVESNAVIEAAANGGR